MTSRSDLRKQIIQLLNVMSQSQNIVQCIKQALVMHEQFSPIALFQTISNGKQRCTNGDVKQFLEKHSIQFSRQELREYLKESRLGKEFTFHEFIDTIIPFNADALRVYKESYLEKLTIRTQDLEVELIYKELLSNEFKFIRTIEVIKSEILESCGGDVSRVKQLIKADLVNRSKIRQAKKFQQKFQNPREQLSFIDIRRFLELHTSTHEVVLLNLMRKLRTQDPMKPISLRLEEKQKDVSRSRSNHRSKELKGSRSKSKGKTQGAFKGANYNDFKKQLEREYEAHQSVELNKQNRKESREKSKNKSATRWRREKKNIDGTLIRKLLQTIIEKEQVIEKHRRKLYQAKEFNMINLFKLIDQNRSGAISQHNLIKFINSTLSSPSSSSLSPLFIHFSKQSSGLRFHQLYSILQPLSKQLIRSINDKQQDPIPNPFREKTLHQVTQIILLTNETLIEIGKVREEINNRGEDVEELFEYVDMGGKGEIRVEDVKRLLDEEEFFTDRKDMKLLWRYFGKRTDERVGKEEWRRLVEM